MFYSFLFIYFNSFHFIIIVKVNHSCIDDPELLMTLNDDPELLMTLNALMNLHYLIYYHHRLVISPVPSSQPKPYLRVKFAAAKASLKKFTTFFRVAYFTNHHYHVVLDKIKCSKCSKSLKLCQTTHTNHFLNQMT